jgi:hypothetical protein
MYIADNLRSHAPQGVRHDLGSGADHWLCSISCLNPGTAAPASP